MLSAREDMRVVAGLLDHGNAPAHNALSLWQFWVKKNIAVLEQPLYLPDFALCDFSFSQVEGDQQGDPF